MPMQPLAYLFCGGLGYLCTSYFRVRWRFTAGGRRTENRKRGWKRRRGRPRGGTRRLGVGWRAGLEASGLL